MCDPHGIYPLLPAPNGVPWSEYVRSQRNRSRSISSSTESLQLDHARYITRRIAQHARSMATGTRSLPADSPVPYFQPIEREHMSEGRLSDLSLQENIYVPPYVNQWEKTIRPGGTDYHANASEIDRVSTYTRLDNYDTLFATRHGRRALDQVPTMSEHMIMTSSMGIIPITSGAGVMVNPLNRAELTSNLEHLNQRESASMTKDPLEDRVVSPNSKIIGEGAAIFTDMTETILNALDQQMAMSSDVQKLKGLSICDNQMKETQSKIQITSERYPDLFLPVVENHRASGYSDSLSADNNPMVLVKFL